MVLSLPNLITYGRLILIPVLAVLMWFMDARSESLDLVKCYGIWAAVVFAIAGFSDLLDGYVARKYKSVSLLGKFFDPMADKLIHMTALVMLIPLGRIQAWVVVILLFREIFVTGIRAVAAGQGMIIDAASWGKYKTAWLNFGIGGLILYYPVFDPWFSFNVYGAGQICVWIGMVFSVLSGALYSISFFKAVAAQSGV